MKIKIPKPIIVDAEFEEKTGEIPSFQKQIEEESYEIDNDVVEGAMLVILPIIMIFIAVVLFHPATQERIRNKYPTIIYRCNKGG